MKSELSFGGEKILTIHSIPPIILPADNPADDNAAASANLCLSANHCQR